MPPFRVMLKGAPVFVVDESSEKTNRFGFCTTRWVQAPSADEAKAVAIRAVFEELAETGGKNPPDEPVRLAVEDIVEISLLEMARRGPGRGFTFYPDTTS